MMKSSMMMTTPSIVDEFDIALFHVRLLDAIQRNDPVLASGLAIGS